MTAITASHLLRLELVLLLIAATALLLIPTTTVRALGLPAAGSALWPRLVGMLLLGLAAALVATDQGWLTLSTAKGPLATGLGLGALVAIHLTVAFVLATMLVFGTDVSTKRGRLLLWTLALASFGLGLVEIAYLV
jgi:hypothetical protein